MKKRPQLTRGTIAVILLTAVTLVLSVGFILSISGSDITSRTAHLMHQLELDKGHVLAQAADSFTPPPAAVTPVPTPTPAATQVPVEEVRFTIACAGTVQVTEALLADAREESGEYDFESMMTETASVIETADLAMGVLMTQTGEAPYDAYLAPSALLGALRASGMDLVSLATEHALEHGGDALGVTRADLTTRGLSFCGVREVPEAWLSIDGLRLAVLACTYAICPESQVNGETEEVCAFDLDSLCQQIAGARADGANIVIVLPRWETATEGEVPPQTENWTRALGEAGADLIVGSRTEPEAGAEKIEVTRRDGRSHECLVISSLGQLLGQRQGQAGKIAKITMVYHPQTRLLEFGSIEEYPVRLSRGGQGADMRFRLHVGEAVTEEW